MAFVPTATNSGHQDANQNYSVIGVQGTLGTADIEGSAPTLPIGVNPATGAMYVHDLAGGGGGTTVQFNSGTISAGTINRVGTVGILELGTVTITNPTGTTVQFNNGTVDLLKAGTVTRLEGGTISTNLLSGTLNSGTVGGGFVEQTGLSVSSLNGDLVPSTDVSAYKSLGLHILGTFVGTISFQASNDNSNWVGVRLQDLSSANNSGTLVTSANELRIGHISARYFRVRMVSYTSGTATGVLELYTLPINPVYSAVNQNSTWTVQPGNTPNTTPWLIAGTTVQSTGTINAGTINTGTINTGTVVIPSGTITVLPNLPQGSINVTAGTITAGSIVVTNGTISHGTIDSGTVQLNPKPTIAVNSYGTTTAGTIGTLIAAPSAGSSIFVTSLDVSQVTGTAESVVSWGVVAQGNQVLSRGLYTVGGGIAKSYTPANSGSATGTALTFNLLSGAGTISYNVSYFVAVP